MTFRTVASVLALAGLLLLVATGTVAIVTGLSTAVAAGVRFGSLAVIAGTLLYHYDHLLGTTRPYWDWI